MEEDDDDGFFSIKALDFAQSYEGKVEVSRTRRSEKLEVGGKVKGWEKDSGGNLMFIEMGSSVGLVVESMVWMNECERWG